MVNEVWESPCLSLSSVEVLRACPVLMILQGSHRSETGSLCVPPVLQTPEHAPSHHSCYQKDLGGDNLGSYNLPALSPWVAPHGAQEKVKSSLAWPMMLHPNGPPSLFFSAHMPPRWSLLSALPCTSGSFSPHGPWSNSSPSKNSASEPRCPLVCSSHLSVNLRFASWGFASCGFTNWGQLLSKNSKWKIPGMNSCVGFQSPSLS